MTKHLYPPNLHYEYLYNKVERTWEILICQINVICPVMRNLAFGDNVLVHLGKLCRLVKIYDSLQ